ncbi:hypothetical protein QJS10_CPB11g01311 [Acorus calamus]|uniref:CCHC-type domain-containing protein n=1 Tax=Acorus calamus TaxID=4465 RepID=A0AAV9DTW1_ACOCL|nr:hypothetical protein QJS10_CPB11g01311 [Acorus calamus]
MDEIFEEVGKLVKWGENNALNMQYKVPDSYLYDTLSNETDMLKMFSLHQRSPIIEIFSTIEHNIASSVLPTLEDRETQNRCRYYSSNEGDDYEDDYGEGAPQSFSDFFFDAEDYGREQMPSFLVVFEEEEDDEPDIRKGRAHNVTIEEIDDEEQIEPIQFNHLPKIVDEWQAIEADRICSEADRKWQMLEFPCNHAAAVVAHMRNERWEDYVDECYTIARQVHGEYQELQFTVKPPKCIRPPSKPRKKRITPHDEESRSTKVRKIHRCKRCGGLGHYQKTCKNPPMQSNSGQTLDGQSTDDSRGYCDGDLVIGGRGRGYGSGMFSYGSGGHTRGFMGLRRPPRSS